MHHQKTRLLTLVGTMAALTAVLAQLSVPLPGGVALTLQTFAVALCGCVLGPLPGAAAVLAYLALGLCGFPVFAGFRGGPDVLLGPSGGFLWGFLILAALAGAGRRHTKPLSCLLGLLGLAACHFLGVAQYTVLRGAPFRDAAALWESAVAISLPFWIKDAASVLLAIPMAEVLCRRLPWLLPAGRSEKNPPCSYAREKESATDA